ncbi:unnamed protein product [Aphanomyces euteiches]|uniref:PX domain-containing protein n=1 Tax=Aphanomyces euteiches TaxID=100861 RepID=A0A6G0WMJ1_9STRA|nr:hypothetical protein Ae201684_013530 [Aphanomyces euteiches]KAH9093929.1 hypothetical protein Ae201684P_016549 [Aphanomyces euteiches]
MTAPTETNSATSVMRIKTWRYANPSDGNSFVEYAIVVNARGLQAKCHAHVYTIHRRYAQFDTLHRALRDQGFALPNMPTADLWTNILIKLTPDAHLEQRRQQLQNVLDCINLSPQMQSTAAYQEFVGASPETTKYTSFRDVQLVAPTALLKQDIM